MGEAGDDAIDRGMDEWLSSEYDDSGDCGVYVLRPKTCRHCKVSSLEWGISSGRYRLFDSAGNIHVCATARLNSAARKVFK